MSFAKCPPIRSKKWLSVVHDIECCVRCGAYGVQAAHRDWGKGMGMKTSDHLVAALCERCHYELGNGKTLTQAQRRAEMDTAIVKTLDELVRRGLVGVR